MNMRKFWLWNLLAVGIMEGCAARHLAVEEAVELLDQESLVRSKVEQDLALFTAKRGRPPSSIEELYPNQTPPIRFWGLPYEVKLEEGKVIVER